MIPPGGEQARDKLTTDDLERIISHYSQVIQLDPDFAVAYFNRGLAYYSKGDPDRAVSDWNAAIRLNPADAEAYFYRGLAYDEIGDKESAIADLHKALELCDDHSELLCQNAQQLLEKLGAK